uniref:Unconventional myosin-VI n=1 Tax=Syphacia muris TaxID=451379 RepID=A0A0N5ASZ6_9BILA
MSPRKPSLDFGQCVWVSDLNEGYVLGKLRDIGNEKMTVYLLDSKKTVTAAYDQVFPAEEDQSKDVDDNCALMYLNEATFLQNCRIRYQRKKIYSYVANILICINPYEQIPELYSKEMIKKYRGKSLGTLPPHIFAVADKAYRDMRRFKENQSIIVSGESGAGKTESQKLILRYLCESCSSSAGSIEKRILETNSILEAFGNAKTYRNNNSSRFGKFVEIHFNSKHVVAGGYISHYLLEKTRICLQHKYERNYHIFYQLIAAAETALASELNLAPPDHFNKDDLYDELVDDYANFVTLNKALIGIGVAEKDVKAVFQTVVAVLHLGNILFEETSDGSTDSCTVSKGSEDSLKIAAKLLGLEPNGLRNGLLFRILQPAKGGEQKTMIRVPLRAQESAAARDALAKTIYSRMFDWLVAVINRAIPFGDSVSYIGVLDIAGFEFFTVNLFEQFCINYCNEKLQKFFTDKILKQEQELYTSEFLNVPHIAYSDNQDCIELFEDKSIGLLAILDEEARLPKSSAKHFTARAHQLQKNHFRLDTPRHSKLREHREMRDDECFLIRHFAGSVCYNTEQFLEKNNDALHMSLEVLVQDSSLFPITLKRYHDREPMSKLAFASVSHKFRMQLEQLLERLKSMGTHFVRCLKPNSNMQHTRFEGGQILSQLKCAGMTNVLKLMQNGYPSRVTFTSLYNMYKTIMPPELIRLDPRLFCKCLFGAFGLNDNDFKFGITKIFFKPGKFAEFDEVYSILLKAFSVSVKNKICYRASALITIQSALRGYIIRKEQKSRAKKAEQERLDAELASDCLPANSTTRYNLSNLKYPELRDIINTSNDIELITACRDEFYQRLKAYHHWKQNTDKCENEQLRAPASVVELKNAQRYFKVPFDRPASQGLWYAHFDGQWIARQMEIRPNERPLLLIAGRDDINMCEIPLQNTQLTRKKGAEILADEFETLWRYYGGPPYKLGLTSNQSKA